MKTVIFLIFLVVSVSAFALAPAERALVQLALDNAKAEKVFRTQQTAELEAAKLSNLASESSAKATEDRAVAAEKASAIEDKDNARMRPIIKQVNSWWGIGGIIYGVKRLAVHVLILIAVLVVLSIIFGVLSFALKGTFPWLAPVVNIILGIWVRVLSIFKRKPTT